MSNFDDLIYSYVASDLDASTVEAWFNANTPSGDALNALAELIGAAFLAGKITFVAANGLLNLLMPLAGFEAVPTRLWEYYVAFENFETSNSPDADARHAIAAMAGRGAA